MGLKAINSLMKAVAKKAYVAPKMEVRTLESLGLKMEQLTGDLVQVKNTFVKPNTEKLKLLKEGQGLHEKIIRTWSGEPAWHGVTESSYITDNNSLFLDYLSHKFPRRVGVTTNEEVQKLMLYLQDINHSGYSNKGEFIEKFLEDVKYVESLADRSGKQLYKTNAHALYTKKAILEAKYNNPERYKDLMDLIKLYQDGVIPKHNIALFFPKGTINPLIKADMQRILSGQSYFPQFAEVIEKDILKLDLGEAFSIGDKMYVRTQSGYKALKIDKKTYETLFPPIERYSISQGDAGNCGKIAAWNSMIKNPETRILLYDMFEQTPEGIKITMRDGKYTKLFRLDDLSCLDNAECLQGSLGYKMLEHTYDYGHTGHIQTGNGMYESMVSHITGKTHVDSWGCIAYENALQKNDGLFFINNGTKDLNSGKWDSHWYSSINRKSGIWQNPWTGVEDLHWSSELIPPYNFI